MTEYRTDNGICDICGNESNDLMGIIKWTKYGPYVASACPACRMAIEWVEGERSERAARQEEEALERLKAQETRFIVDGYLNPMCRSCGFKPFMGFVITLDGVKNSGYKYCPGCGRKVKWE